LSNSKDVLHVIRKLGVTGVLQSVAAAAKNAFERDGKKGLSDFMRDNPYLNSEAQNFFVDVFEGKFRAKQGRPRKNERNFQLYLEYKNLRKSGLTHEQAGAELSTKYSGLDAASFTKIFQRFEKVPKRRSSN